MVNSFSEIIEAYNKHLPKEKIVSPPIHFQISNAKNWMQHGLFHWLGDKAKWMNEYDQVADWLTDNNGRGLLCMGNCGRGKTLLCTKIIPPILLATDNRVLQSFTMQEVATHLDSLLTKRILCLDDVGTEADSVKYGERRQPFVELVDSAERNNGILVITTNLTAQEIAAKYGERTLDRLRALTKLVHFKGESMRS